MSKPPLDRPARTLDAGGTNPLSSLSSTPVLSLAVAPRSTHFKSWKTRLAFALVFFQISCNAALLFVTLQTVRLGVRISGYNWRVNDGDIITAIELFSKLLIAITLLLSGWAMSQHWGRRLRDPVTGTGLAELESLGVFQSVVAIPRVLIHAIQNRFVTSNRLYFLLACSSIFLQLYSTALVTLATPLLTYVDLPPQSFYTIDNSPGFMTKYINGLCTPGSQKPSCSPFILTETATRDARTVPSKGGFCSVADVWQPILTDHNDGWGHWINGILWLGPLGPSGYSNFTGVAMYGLNLAAVDDAIFMLLDGWNSITTTVQFNTTVPVLTSSCISDVPSVPSIFTLTIQNQTYQLPSALPSLRDDQVVGHVFNSSLLLSFGAGANEPTKHCIVKLMFQNATLGVQGRNNTLDGSPNAYFVTHTDIYRSSEQVPTQDDLGAKMFFTLWLEGMGWGQTPSSSPLAKFFGGLKPAEHWNYTLKDSTYDWSEEGSDPYYPCDTFQGPLEYSALTMFSAGASAAFSSLFDPGVNDQDDPIYSTPEAPEINCTVQTQEFYIGHRSPTRYFFMFIIVFESCFAIGCLYVITQQGWLPDWTGPTTLIVGALRSDSSDSLLRVSGDGSLHPSSRVWECSLMITEASGGIGDSLAITLVPSAVKSVGHGDAIASSGKNSEGEQLLLEGCQRGQGDIPSQQSEAPAQG